MTIISCLSLVDLLAASELPAPFTQLETTSTAGVMVPFIHGRQMKLAFLAIFLLGEPYLVHYPLLPRLVLKAYQAY